jgi:hypothetical protein
MSLHRRRLLVRARESHESLILGQAGMPRLRWRSCIGNQAGTRRGSAPLTRPDLRSRKIAAVISELGWLEDAH